MSRCEVRELGRVTYENGMLMQEALVELRQREEIPDQFLLLEHPPVITLGRGGKMNNLLASSTLLEREGVRFYETTRGGDITYHGPGQIVGYPIVHLGEKRRDIRKYVEAIEEVLIRTVSDYGVSARRWDINRGIWVSNDKLGAIGVRVARWVTSHGFALNVSTNLRHFSLINPCGLLETGVTSLEKLTGEQLPLADVRKRLIHHFGEVFDRKMILRNESVPVVQVLVTDGSRLLLIKRTETRGGNWQPVTGRIEAGERPEETAARELREETGLDVPVENLGLRQSFLIQPEYAPGFEQPAFADMHTFYAVVTSGVPVRLAPEEHEEHGWFSFDEAVARVRWTDDRDAIEALRARVAAS